MSYLAAERRKICSPRREPWVKAIIGTHSRGAATHFEAMTLCFAPLGLFLLL